MSNKIKSTKQIKESIFKYYYKELLSHRLISSKRENAKTFLRRMYIIDIAILLLCLIYIFFKNTTLVKLFTEGANWVYCFHLIAYVYLFLALLSFTIYNQIAYNYEGRYKHELLVEDVKGVYIGLVFLYRLIHFPWIIIAAIIHIVFVWLRIPDIKEDMPIITCGYLFAFIFELIGLKIMLNGMDYLISMGIIPINSWVTKTTYLYLSVLIIIIVGKYIPIGLLE